MSFEPPTPGYRRPAPPPPNFAQSLVARSGAVVYEGGRSVFDESVLVYRARPKKQWPGFDVVDHIGKPLAVVVGQGPLTRFTTKRRAVVMDLHGSSLFSVRPMSKLLSTDFVVSGVAKAVMVSKGSGRTLSIVSNNELFGSIVGTRFSGLTADRITILDEREQQVGVIRTFHRGSFFAREHDHVLSFQPGLRGPLRQLLVAVPPALAVIRRLQDQSSG